MDNEILFENKTNLNRSILLGGAKLWVQSFKGLKILIYAIMFVSICLALFNLFIEQYFLAVVPILAVVFLLFYPKFISAIIIKKQKYTFDLERLYSVYNDRLEIKVAQNKTVIPFHMIKAFSENKNNFYMIYENQIICISKSGFRIGRSNEFSNFIKSKVNFE